MNHYQKSESISITGYTSSFHFYVYKDLIACSVEGQWYRLVFYRDSKRTRIGSFGTDSIVCGSSTIGL